MVVCTVGRHGMPEVTGQFNVIFEKPGVHHADFDALAMKAERISSGCFLCHEAPVLHVFISFPGSFGFVHLQAAVGDKAGFHIGGRSHRRAKGSSDHSEGNGSLGGLAMGVLRLVSNNKLLTDRIPHGLVNLIHV